MSCYSRLILHLGASISMVISFTSRPLYLQDPLKRIYVGFYFDLQAKDNRKTPYPCLISNCLYPGHCND